jgi:hypothetical protein
MELEELGFWMAAVTDYNRAVDEATSERRGSTKQ